MNKLTVRIPEDLHKQLRELCRQQNRSMSDVVREVLSRYITHERFQALRRKIVPRAKAQGFVTDEDVFRKIPRSPLDVKPVHTDIPAQEIVDFIHEGRRRRT